MQTLSITLGDHTNRDRAVEIFSEAFMDDPVISWLLPSKQHRREVQPYMHGAFVDQALRSGRVQLVVGRGAAVWITLKAGETPYGQPANSAEAEGLGTLLGTAATRLEALGNAVANRHPLHCDHVYLSTIGVVPEWQGHGIGAAMLTEQLSDTHLPVYLEASDERNRKLYQRFGFHDLGNPIDLPEGPSLWPMWREISA